MTAKLFATPTGNSRRHCSTLLAKPKLLKFESPKITRPSSATPIEAITFLEENEIEKLTDDWSKSLLYKKIANGDDIKLQMTEQEMLVSSRKPPRDPEMISQIMTKGMDILTILLMELLGTKEDMQRFQERFQGRSPVHVRALMERCMNLMNIRNSTVEILIEVNQRELILKNLESSKNRIKDKILKIYRLNKIIREKIMKWIKDETIPFTTFVFKGKDYLKKISEDNVVLQEYLTCRSVSKTRLK